MLKKISSLLMLLFIFTSCDKQVERIYTQSELPSFKVDMSAYGINSINHNFKQVKMTEVYKAIEEDKSGIFVLSYTTCKFCLKQIPMLSEAAKNLGVSIYYIDAYDPTYSLNGDQNNYNEFISYFSSVLRYENGEQVILTPMVFSLVDGKFEDVAIGNGYDVNTYGDILIKFTN